MSPSAAAVAVVAVDAFAVVAVVAVAVVADAAQNFDKKFGEEQMAGFSLTYVLSDFKCEPSPSWEK